MKQHKYYNQPLFITNRTNMAYIKTKEKAENLTEDNQQSSEKYDNDMLEDMVLDTSNTAQELAKRKFRQSVQKKRAVNAQQNKAMRTNTAVLVENSAQFRQINTVQNTAKERVVKNSIRARVTGATTVKEKVVEFIKGSSRATLNTAKITIANTKIITAALLATGSVAVIFTIIICIIGLVMGSSFGIFMATEDTGTGYTLNMVIQEINEEYLTEIEKIKTEVSHDDLEMPDTTPNWKDILAVYAVKVTTAHEGAEVVTVDEERSELIREVFWDMTEIIYETEFYEETTTIQTTDEQGNIIEQEIIVTKTKLIINKKNKTATEAAVEYEFDENQYMQLQELICDNNSGMWIFAEKNIAATI